MHLETSHSSCNCFPSYEQLPMCRHSRSRVEFNLHCLFLSGEPEEKKMWKVFCLIYVRLTRACARTHTHIQTHHWSRWLPLKYILVGAPWLALLIWANCFPGRLQISSPGISFYSAPKLVPLFLASYNSFWITFYLILSEENSLGGIFYM